MKILNTIKMNVSTTKCPRGVNPDIVKNIALCIFLVIAVIYLKVYISRMEMSLRYQISLGP